MVLIDVTKFFSHISQITHIAIDSQSYKKGVKWSIKTAYKNDDNSVKLYKLMKTKKYQDAFTKAYRSINPLVNFTVDSNVKFGKV